MDTPDVVMDVVGGVPRVTPPPTDVLVDHDAFRWGKVLLGASVTVLQVLSTTSPQSGKALARRLDVQPSTARYHLKKLRHLGLLVQSTDGVLLSPSWRESLDSVAQLAGISGRQEQERTAVAELRLKRKEARRDWARANGIPLRRDTVLTSEGDPTWAWVEATDNTERPLIHVSAIIAEDWSTSRRPIPDGRLVAFLAATDDRSSERAQ